MAQDLGGIYYEVDLETSNLIASVRKAKGELGGLGGSMGGLESSVNRTERSISSLSSSMSSLTNIAKSVAAAITVQQVAEYGNAWVTVNNKLINSVRANEDLAAVTQRVFDISQDTRSSLEATATLYGRLERATRSAGTSTDDLAKLVETINKGLTVSGATTEEASSTMIQLSQALASGVLRGEEFNSISENGSRLAVALADSLGVTIGQLRAMAAQGKLTTEVVVNGLLKQSDQIAKEFANTTMTMSQAFSVATNNITKFVGEASSVSTTINVFNQGVISLSENLDVVAQAVGAAALVFGGRFVGSLAAATAAQATNVMASIQGATATRARAKEELAAATVTQRRAVADKSAAMSALNLATAEYNVAKGSSAEAFALENVIRLRAIYVQSSSAAALSNNAVAASQARVAATGFTMASAMTALKAVTAPLGGPLGVIGIVAAGWYLYAQNQEEARKESIAFAQTLPDVISKLKEMNLVQAQGVRADTVTSIKNQEEALKSLNEEISELSGRYKDAKVAADNSAEGSWANNSAVEAAADLENQLAKKIRDRDSAQQALTKSQDALRLINIQVNQGIVDQMKAARDSALALAEAEKKTSLLGGSQSFLAEKLGIATKELQKFNAESLKINWGGSDGEKLLKQAERRLELSKKEGEAKARQQAAYDAEDAGITDERAIKTLQDKYAATEKNTAARKEQKKEDKSAASEAKKLENQQESVTNKLASLKQQSELAADSTRELSREQAILKAQQSLGKAATQDQIKQAGEYAAKTWDINNALKAQAAAEKLIPERQESTRYTQETKDLKTALDAKKMTKDEFNQATERAEQQHQSNLAKIRSDAVVSPINDARGSIDPVQQLANENARKLALIQQFETEKGQITANGLALMNAANRQYEQQRLDAQWEIFRNQSQANELLATSLDGLQSGASSALTGLINGTQSLQEAFANIGTTILNSVISSFVQMGIEWVKAQVMGQAAATASLAATMAQATAAESAWAPAAMSASIATYGTAAAVGQTAYAGSLLAAKGMAVAGARKNGGPVSAGEMYRVGEGGMPEIYQASSGRQYMIPGDNGKVISNKDMQGGGGGGAVIHQTVEFHIQTTGGIDDATMAKMSTMMKQVSINTIRDQQRPSGLLQRSR
ncbi:tape measure protein [Cedecea sp. P7760]|uniref:tape measure protein n=1 Tax=Cedecea sp. P7760 TaxID=2726983 RepID=UPI0015A2C85A|nr:tape measure protein [Cedecea sp. P7760]NWC63756.1 tape measure protein [Cedecea sp. P7760]